VTLKIGVMMLNFQHCIHFKIYLTIHEGRPFLRLMNWGEGRALILKDLKIEKLF